MRIQPPLLLRICLPLVLTGAVSDAAFAFDSGSTGVDGAFNPSTSVTLALPTNGIFNFTDVTVAAGVVVTFTANASNTPVRILASGDVTIDGTVRVDGEAGGPFNDSSAGAAGPGGHAGGRGGLFNSSGEPQGGDGLGPGRGTGAPNCINCEAGGASFGSAGSNGNVSGTQGTAGPVYGNSELLPLIGGSGGGGGGGFVNLAPGGGGGGGALLVAASGTLTVNGTISALGGDGGAINSAGRAGVPVAAGRSG